MALAHHPDPEEVDCLLRNAELRDAIEPYLDEAIFEIDFRFLPTESENRFLESMLAWEQARWCRLPAGSSRCSPCSPPARSTTSRCTSGSGR